MSFPRPSIATLRDRVAAEIEAELGIADPRVARSVERALSRGVAILAHELHGHLQWIFEQRFPDTAEAEYLERHGALIRPVVTRRKALAASGLVDLTGAVGTIIPAGTELRRADDVRFRVDVDAEIGVAETGEALVTAVLEGSLGNTGAGTALTFIAPVAGLASIATVDAGGITGGVNVESDDSLRARIIERMQAEADGGNADDYAGWVQDVVGKTRVFVYPLHMGAGTVGIAFVMPDGSMPDGTTLDAVTAYLDLQKPVHATLHVFAPVTHAVDLSILLRPGQQAVRDAVTAELADFFVREAEPGGIIPLSRLRAAISAATGEHSHELAMPSADIVSPAGHIARLGTITWVAE